MITALSVILMLYPGLYAAYWGIGLLMGDMSDIALIGFLLLYPLPGIAVSVLYGVFGKAKKISPKRLSVYNLLIKLTALPIDVLTVWFITVRTMENIEASANGAAGVGLSVFVLILVAIPYLITRIATHVSAIIVSCRLSKGRWLPVIAHIFPIADLVGAIYLCCTAKKKEA